MDGFNRFSGGRPWPFGESFPWKFNVEEVKAPFGSMLASATQKLQDVHSKVTEDGVEVAVPVPGCRKEDISVSYEERENMMKIMAIPNEEYDFDLPEVNIKFIVGTEIDEASIKAKVSDGVLLIEASFAKPEEATKKIVVT